MKRQPEQAPGVVSIRLSGEAADLDVLTAALAGLTAVEILSRSAGRPNRYDPGERRYLTVRLQPSGGAS